MQRTVSLTKQHVKYGLKKRKGIGDEKMKRVIVVGAGILGASTAYHLAKKGAQVTVVDRKDVGQATEAAAGIICPWLSQRRNKAWYALAKNGAASYLSYIRMLEEDGEYDTGYKKVGAISLHTDKKKLDGMEERATLRREDAQEIGHIQQLTEEQTREQFPLIDERFRSVYVSGAARVNGRALRDAFIRGAKKHGASFIEGSATLCQANHQMTGVQVGDELFHAETVIVAAGAWARELVEPLGVNLQIGGQKAQIAHLKTDDKTANWPVVMPPNNQYMLAFDEGEIVVGATYEDGQDDLAITVGGLHEIFTKALDVAPSLQEASFTEARVGFRPFTPNFMPVIGEVPNVTGLLLANGLGSSGLTVGPYLGEQLSKLALGEEITLDLRPYAIEQIVEE